MPDVFSPQERSQIMSRVRGQGNKATELALVATFRRHGVVGWRRRVAVFADGCFWHGCAKHGTQPVSNRALRAPKLARNKARDQLVRSTQEQRGWFVLRVWRHEILRRNEARLAKRIQRLLAGREALVSQKGQR